MSDQSGNWVDMLREWKGNEHVHILLIVVAAIVLTQGTQYLVPRITTKVRPDNRFYVLPWIPLVRLAIIIGAASLILPLVIIPTRENVLITLGAMALAAGFVLKDYLSCLFAGIMLLAERAYRIGDWVQIGDTYGEVVELGLRTVTLRTADANDVSIPHNTLLHEPLVNATSGQHDLLCVVDFFVHPDHGRVHVREALASVATASVYLKPDCPIVVVVSQKPFGLHYKVKAYPKDARDQFYFIADVTERGLIALHTLGLTLVTAPVLVAAQGKG